jgi:hypothetical protein
MDGCSRFQLDSADFEMIRPNRCCSSVEYKYSKNNFLNLRNKKIDAFFAMKKLDIFIVLIF